MNTDVAIIGAGPSGLFASFQAGMLGMKSCIIDIFDVIGGQCAALYPEKPIYDVPAYPEIIAMQLVEKLAMQAAPFSPQYRLSQQVTGLKVNSNSFELATSAGNVINAKIVLIAAGAGAFGPNRPPLEGIASYEGKSVFYFVANKADFAGKKIVIAGGGDSAIDWAISLSGTSKVYLVHRRNKFRAAPASVEKIHELSRQGKIELIPNYQLHSLNGSNGVLEEVIIVDLDGNQKVLKADVLLPFFGLSQDLGPITDFGLNLSNHHIQVNYPYFETNIPGIYAIGDVATYEGKLKLILTSFSEAASALHHGYKRVFDGKPLHFEYSTTKGITKL